MVYSQTSFDSDLDLPGDLKQSASLTSSLTFNKKGRGTVLALAALVMMVVGVLSYLPPKSQLRAERGGVLNMAQLPQVRARHQGGGSSNGYDLRGTQLNRES